MFRRELLMTLTKGQGLRGLYEAPDALGVLLEIHPVSPSWRAHVPLIGDIMRL